MKQRKPRAAKAPPAVMSTAGQDAATLAASKAPTAQVDALPPSQPQTAVGTDALATTAANGGGFIEGKTAAWVGDAVDENDPPAVAPSAIAARFEAEIARAAAIGRRLAQAGSSLMSTLPPGASDQEIGLHLIHENVSRFEKAVRTLELATDDLPSGQGD